MLNTAFSGGVGTQQNGVLSGLLPQIMGAGKGGKLDMRAFLPVLGGMSYDPQIGVGGQQGLPSKKDKAAMLDQNTIMQLIEAMRTMKIPGQGR